KVPSSVHTVYRTRNRQANYKAARGATRRADLSKNNGQLASEAELRTPSGLERLSPGLRERGYQNRHRNRRIAQHRESLRVLCYSPPGLSLLKTASRCRAAFRQVEPDLQCVLMTAHRLFDHTCGYLSLLDKTFWRSAAE